MVRPTTQKDHSGTAVKMRAKLQAQRGTKARERSTARLMVVVSKGQAQEDARYVMEAASLYLPPSTFIPSPGKGTTREQGPLLYHSARHIIL